MGFVEDLGIPLTPAPHATALRTDRGRVWMVCTCGATGITYRNDSYGRDRAKYAAIWHHNLNTKEQEQ